MSEEFIPDPIKSYKPKQPVNVQSTPAVGDVDAITPQTPATLESMPKEALISLIERMARQCGLVAMMSEEEIRQAFLDRMAHIGLTAKAVEALAAMDKRMDRIEGKSMTRVDTRNVHAFTMMPTVKRNGKEVTFNVGEPVTLDHEQIKI